MNELSDILREKVLPELADNLKRVRLEIELENGFIESIELRGQLNKLMRQKNELK